MSFYKLHASVGVDPCTAEVEFEFTTWVQPKATADFHSCGAPTQFLIVCLMCAKNSSEMGKKLLPEQWLAVATSTNPPFWQWPWTQAANSNSNSTSAK